MSQGAACKCGEHQKPVRERKWVVWQRNCNYSAFNGYHWTYSDYSCMTCHVCGAVWRTKASYVALFPDGGHMYDKKAAPEDAASELKPQG